MWKLHPGPAADHLAHPCLFCHLGPWQGAVVVGAQEGGEVSPGPVDVAPAKPLLCSQSAWVGDLWLIGPGWRAAALCPCHCGLYAVELRCPHPGSVHLSSVLSSKELAPCSLGPPTSKNVSGGRGPGTEWGDPGSPSAARLTGCELGL